MCMNACVCLSSCECVRVCVRMCVHSTWHISPALLYHRLDEYDDARLDGSCHLFHQVNYAPFIQCARRHCQSCFADHRKLPE